jgi:hypothetical protein
MLVRKNNVVYSEELRDIVLKAHPGDEKIEKLLDENSYLLEQYLDGYAPCINVDVITQKIKAGKTDELLEMCNVLKLQKRAYELCRAECYEELV